MACRAALGEMISGIHGGWDGKGNWGAFPARPAERTMHVLSAFPSARPVSPVSQCDGVGLVCLSSMAPWGAWDGMLAYLLLARMYAARVHTILFVRTTVYYNQI